MHHFAPNRIYCKLRKIFQVHTRALCWPSWIFAADWQTFIQWRSQRWLSVLSKAVVNSPTLTRSFFSMQLCGVDGCRYVSVAAISAPIFIAHTSIRYFAFIDFIPLDISFRLETFIQQYPSAELIASKDVSNMINTGAFLLRRSTWSEHLLIKWLAMRLKPEAINDQSGFDLLFHRYLDPVDRQKITILPSHEFNSVAPAMSQQLPSHKVRSWRNLTHCEDIAVSSPLFPFANASVPSFGRRRWLVSWSCLFKGSMGFM